MNRILSIDEFIEKHEPCDDAQEYLKTQPTLEVAWENCKRGDWMLWVARRVNYQDIKSLQWIALEVAESVQHLMTDERSTNALEVTKRYLLGQATQDELENAAAYAAAYSAAYSAAYAAAYAADAAAYAAYAACAAYAATRAAYAAAYVVDAYIADAAEQAGIVRKHITWQHIESYLSVNESEA